MSKHLGPAGHTRVSSNSDVDSEQSSVLADQDRPAPEMYTRQGSKTAFSRQSSMDRQSSLNRSGKGVRPVPVGLEVVSQLNQDVETGASNWPPELSPTKNSPGDSIFYDLSVINLTYKVKLKKGKVIVEKALLNGVTASAKHGEVLAIAGPSGSSKTTFLDAIAGRIQRQSLEGTVLVNGKPWDASFMKKAQYVMQDDALFPLLTTRETLMFSARFRLPSSMSYAEKLRRVDIVIQQLGLKNCANTNVGNDVVKGVSGGERRRVSIGVELIHDPSVIFLDEPTSGLDSTSALHVMEILSTLATERNRTVALTIHQPSYRILDLIQSMLVLARGNVVYYGPFAEMANFFRDIGRNIPEHVNIVEFALDTIEEVQEDPEGFTKLIGYQKEKQKKVDEVYTTTTDSIEPTERHKFENNFISETITLTDRTTKNIFRTKELFLSRVGLMFSTALILGTIFLNVKYTEKGSRQIQAFLAFTLALFIFTSTEALPVFLNERQIFIREVSRGAYRASSYTLAQALVFLPFMLFLALVYVALSYFLVDLVHDVNAFFIMVLTLFLTLAVSNSFVSFVASIAPSFLVANSLGTAVFAYYFLFSGFFIPRSSIPKYWIWLHYLSIFKYPLEILLENEYGRVDQNRIWFGNSTAEDILISLSAGKVHIWNNVAVMVGMFVGYRCLFYLALRFITKSTRK